MRIHPTAEIDPDAVLGVDVEVGSGVSIGAGVRIGDRGRIEANSVLRGPLVLGPDCRIGPVAAVGTDPQVKGGQGPFGRTRLGARNVVREFATVHRSMHEDGETVLGDDNLLMACSHVAHDCRLGSHVVICNAVLLAGHVEVEDHAFIGGNACVHQFCRIGRHAMLGGLSEVGRDAPPYGLIAGARPPLLQGLNTVGLRRAGFSSEVRQSLREAYQTIFRSRLPLRERLESIQTDVEEVRHLVEFVRAARRGVVGFGGRSGRPRSGAAER